MIRACDEGAWWSSGGAVNPFVLTPVDFADQVLQNFLDFKKSILGERDGGDQVW